MEDKIHRNKRMMCTSCHIFYGTQASKGMCSKCYRDNVLGTEALSRAKKFMSHHQKKDEREINLPHKNNHDNQIQNKNPQIDKKRCWKCNIKIGYLGFECKCTYVYCTKHRHPEEHNCSFDFMSEGREKLKEKAVTVIAPKMEKI